MSRYGAAIGGSKCGVRLLEGGVKCKLGHGGRGTAASTGTVTVSGGELDSRVGGLMSGRAEYGIAVPGMIPIWLAMRFINVLSW